MNESNDHLVASNVVECLHVMKNDDAFTKLTTCFNLTERILRLYCVRGDKKWVMSLLDEFYDKTKEMIEELAEEVGED